MTAKLEPGKKAPAFDLPTDGEGRLKLASLKGQKVVLYFYPKAFTKGCTLEAKAFADATPQFAAAGATVIGMSATAAISRSNVSTTSPGKVSVDYLAEVMYPRMQVAGLDFSYSA